MKFKELYKSIGSKWEYKKQKVKIISYWQELDGERNAGYNVEYTDGRTEMISATSELLPIFEPKICCENSNPVKVFVEFKAHWVCKNCKQEVMDEFGYVDTIERRITNTFPGF